MTCSVTTLAPPPLHTHALSIRPLPIVMASTLRALLAEETATIEMRDFLDAQWNRLEEYIHLDDRLISLEFVNELRLIAEFLCGIQRETLQDLEKMTVSLNERSMELLRQVGNKIIDTHNDSINRFIDQ